jgi:hypothetical protein
MQIGKDESLPLQAAFLAKVEQVAHWLAGDSHVVEKLCFVIGV